MEQIEVVDPVQNLQVGIQVKCLDGPKSTIQKQKAKLIGRVVGESKAVAKYRVATTRLRRIVQQTTTH